MPEESRLYNNDHFVHAQMCEESDNVVLSADFVTFLLILRLIWPMHVLLTTGWSPADDHSHVLVKPTLLFMSLDDMILFIKRWINFMIYPALIYSGIKLQ